MKNSVFVGIAFAAVLNTADVFSADMPKGTDENLSCGSVLPINKKLVTLATADGSELAGARGARNNPYIISSFHGNGEDDSWVLGGTVVFVKNNGWKAFLVSEEETVEGIRVSGDDRRVTIFTMHTAEGPGASYTVVTTPNSFETLACGTLEFPKELNHPAYNDEYLLFTDFNSDESGKGRLIGQASIGEKDYWYSYNTEDFGLHWSNPIRSDSKPTSPSGVLREPTKVNLKVLLDDLKSSVR